MTSLALSPPLTKAIEAFNQLVTNGPKYQKAKPLHFIKRLEEIPKVNVSTPQARLRALK